MTTHTRSIAGSMLTICSLGACGESAPAAHFADVADRAGGIAVVCTNVMPESLNSFVSDDLVAADLRMLLYTPLMLYDSVGGVRPYLADDWEWRAERQQLRLRLRDDVRWHDGQPLTAEDVAWTLLAAADTAYVYPGWGDVSSLRDVVVRDPVTLDLLFDRPFVADVEPFIQLPILPAHLLRDVPPTAFARAEYHRAPIGSGPFRFTARNQDGSLQFDRFEDFPADLGRPLLDRIVLRGIPEPSSMMVELQTRAVDLCVTGSSMARDIAIAPELEAVPLAPSGVQLIYLSAEAEPFTDNRVRRAFSAALNRTDIAAAISPLARPARTYLPAGAERWLDPELLEFDADLAYAAAALDSAGWSTPGADGIRRNSSGEPLRFTIAAPQAFRDPLTVVQAQLRRVGMDAQLRVMEGAGFFTMLREPSQRAQAMALSLFPDKFLYPNPRGQLHSGGTVNFSGYSNPRTDSLVERLSTVIPDDERGRIYHQLQRQVVEDVPIVYLLFFPRMLAVGPRMQDIRADLNGPFSAVAGWWIPPALRRMQRTVAPVATVTD
jgi:peptide/nickel transport system substrate-binding protein